MQASDLLIDGTLAPTGLNVVDSNTVSFSLAGLALGEGVHTVASRSARIQDVRDPVSAFLGAFAIDTVGLEVTADLDPPGGVVVPGQSSYR